MNSNKLHEWKNSATQLKDTINTLIDQYTYVLNKYADARDAAAGNDEEKENVDTIFMELTNAKNKLCALNGGRRSSSRRRSKALKRTRKNRG